MGGKRRRLRTSIGRAIAKTIAVAIFPFTIFELRDVLVFGGIGLASYGAALIYRPAAFIGAGLALFIVGKFPGLGAIRNGNPKST